MRQAPAQAVTLLEGLLRAVGLRTARSRRSTRCRSPAKRRRRRDRLGEVLRVIRAARPDLTLTVDPTDHRGFEYHTGMTFSLLGRKVRGEFGRGGRYVNQAGEGGDRVHALSGYAAAGAADAGGDAAVFVPADAAPGAARRLRTEGWTTVHGIETGDARKEAKRLGLLACSCGRQAGLIGLSEDGMANVAVIGSQWGDEGKGKIRRLALRARRCRRAFPGRSQCRPHAGHRQPDLQIVAAAVRHRAQGQALGDRQWRGGRSLASAEGDRHLARPGRRRSRRTIWPSPRMRR